MQHKKHSVFVRLSFCYPISVSSFSEYFCSAFKFGQNFVLSSVIINTLGLIESNLNLIRRNYFCYCGCTFIRVIAYCAAKSNFRNKILNCFILFFILCSRQSEYLIPHSAGYFMFSIS